MLQPVLWMQIMLSSHALSTLFLTICAVCQTTAQHTYIDDDENDLRCGLHIEQVQEQLSRLQQELQEQRRELEELKKPATQSPQRVDAGSNLLKLLTVECIVLCEFISRSLAYQLV